jgi:hypothetical protein
MRNIEFLQTGYLKNFTSKFLPSPIPISVENLVFALTVDGIISTVAKGVCTSHQKTN